MISCAVLSPCQDAVTHKGFAHHQRRDTGQRWLQVESGPGQTCAYRIR